MESANNGKIYILMNKPAGFVCTAASDSHKTVFELLPDEIRLLQKEKRGQRLHTVGRLDCDTSGLLLITNDGNFSHKMTNPDFCVEKKYEAVIKNHSLISDPNQITDEEIKASLKLVRHGLGAQFFGVDSNGIIW